MSLMKGASSITRSVGILKCLADGMDRIADISNKLKLNKSTVHRLLKALGATEFVIREPTTRRYYLGPLFVELVSKPITAHQNLIICSINEMNHLRRLSKETILLHIRMGVKRVCISEFESLEKIRYVSGVIGPIYAGSAGKLLLSQLEENELKIVLDNIQLVQVGPNTITNKEVLLKELSKIREQGYAVSVGEQIAHAAAISVPVNGYICPVTLSIMGPENRFQAKMLDFLPEMKEAASSISENLF